MLGNLKDTCRAQGYGVAGIMGGAPEEIIGSYHIGSRQCLRYLEAAVGIGYRKPGSA